MFGLVMLLLVGVLFPVVAAVLLWFNRGRLDEADFAWKVRCPTMHWSAILQMKQRHCAFVSDPLLSLDAVEAY